MNIFPKKKKWSIPLSQSLSTMFMKYRKLLIKGFKEKNRTIIF